MTWDKLLIIDPTDDVRPLVEPDAKRQRLELHSVTGTGLNALETAFELRPAIVLINVTIPAARPLDVVARVCDALPSTVVVAVVPPGEAELHTKALGRGAYLAIELAHLRKVAGDVLNRATKARARLLGHSHVAPPYGHVVAVLGSKGGVGTTTVAANLAIAARALTHGKTALLDADQPFGDAGFLLGADLHARNQDRDNFDTSAGFECRDIRVVELAGIASPEALRSTIETLRTLHDTVIIDAGTDPERVVAASEYANARLLIATSDLAGARGAALTLRLLRQHGGPSLEVRMLWNRRRPGAPDRDFLARETGIRPDWEIDDDGRLLRAAQDGEPFILRHRSGAAARTMFDVAKVTLGLASRPPNHRPPARRWLHAFGRHAVDRQ